MSRLALRAAAALVVTVASLSAQQQIVVDLSPFTPLGPSGEVLGSSLTQGEVVDARLDVTFVSNDTGNWTIGAGFAFPVDVVGAAIGFDSSQLGWTGTGTFSTTVQGDQMNGLLEVPDGAPLYFWFMSWSGGTVVPLPGGGTGLQSVDGFFETLKLTLTLAPCPFGDPSAPWTDLGDALPGGTGAATLAGEASLCPGEAGALSLTGAVPSGATTLVVGFAALDLPFKGGVLVPSPDLLVPGVTDATGAQTLPFAWPTGVPSGTSLWFQHWYPDAGAPAGLAASNALVATTP